MHPVFLYDKFNYHDLDDGKIPLREKFNLIIKDLKEKKGTSQGSIKLIHSKGGVKYLRAKLSDRDRLLFTSIKYNNEGAFVILEVILSHKYGNSEFLKNKEKIKNIKIVDQNNKEVFDNAGKVKVENAPQVRWLDKFITFSAKQEAIVENAEGKYNLPLVVSGSAGSGKTSVALERLRKIEEEFKEGKILYITKSENLIKKSKELYEYEYYDEAANEPKVGVPEEIEFLSVHEFIEKVTKEGAEMRKRVEGKRPINRNAFFSWFNEKCKKKEFKEYAKDGEKIFEEFTAVIAGGGLKRTQYDSEELGGRQAIFPKEKRANIYRLFEEYKKFIEGSSEYYDTSLIAHECVEKVQANYDAVVVDEVQDLTESTLKLILKSLKDDHKNNFLLCGDVNQVIHPSFFSVSRLKSFLHKGSGHDKGGLQVCTLEKNYRNSKQVIELANRTLHFKNYCFASEDKITTDEEKEAFFMKSDTENTGNVSFIARDEEQEIAEKVPESINWAVLVLNDESKEDARKLFKTPLVFSIQEAKGLEFENVILYEFTSHKAYNEMWDIECPGKGKVENTINEIRNSYNEKDVNTSRNKDKGDKSFEEHKFYINALYVAVTRAINNVYIIDGEKKCNLLKVIKPEKEGNVSIENIKKEESSPEEWRDMALKLIDEGNIEQAKGIAEKLLREREGGYAKEIMSALKAKEKDHTQESQLPLDKNEQAISELKTENPTQESSMGKSSTPAEKSRKRKGQQNQNEEKKSERLEKNTKELFSALKNGDLQKAKKLIKKGVDVNATTSEEGDTPLHVAAHRGYESIAGLLLKHGAKVDATSKDGATPLHLAVEEGHKRVIQLLLEKKANINSTDKDGSTPLFIAAGNGHNDIVQLLLEHRANVDDSNKNGYTPLHIAAQKGCERVAQLLLEHGASVDATTKSGYTPLHCAAQKGYKNVAELLLKNRADVNAKDNKNYTPLHDAAQNGSKGVVQLLLDHKADVNALTKDNITPLLLALQHFHSEVFDLLLADSNINVGCVSYTPINEENRKNYEKYDKKCEQDGNLFKKVKEAANTKDMSKLDELLKEIEVLLKPESKYSFKPSLNYSPDGNDENTTIKIAIKAGRKLLQLLYNYAEKNIDENTEIFKQLKHAKKQQENSQPRSSFNDVTTPHNLAQAQASIT